MHLSLLPGTHLVLEAVLEVTKEGGRLEALDLTVLHSPTVQVVIQLHGEDGSRPALILAAFIAWGTSEQHEPGFCKVAPASHGGGVWSPQQCPGLAVEAGQAPASYELRLIYLYNGGGGRLTPGL